MRQSYDIIIDIYVRRHVWTQKFKLIGGWPKQVYEVMSNSRLRLCGM